MNISWTNTPLCVQSQGIQMRWIADARLLDGFTYNKRYHLLLPQLCKYIKMWMLYICKWNSAKSIFFLMYVTYMLAEDKRKHPISIPLPVHVQVCRCNTHSLTFQCILLFSLNIKIHYLHTIIISQIRTIYEVIKCWRE